MATKQKLERTIAGTEDMASIVSTMKALAAVNVRIFGGAREAIERYMDGVERGLQVVLGSAPELLGAVSGSFAANGSHRDEVAVFVFGAVQGMCGQFNDHIARHAAEYIAPLEARPHIVAVGPRVISRLADRGLDARRSIPMTGSLESLPRVVDDCIVTMEHLMRQGIVRVVLCYNAESGRMSYEPRHELLVPVDEAWLERIVARDWPTRCLPQAVNPRRTLLAAFTRQYLFAGFYRAAAQSLSSENAARLSSMQFAEINIVERLAELRADHNQQRQQEITAELLDIVGGYVALEGR